MRPHSNRLLARTIVLVLAGLVVVSFAAVPTAALSPVDLHSPVPSNLDTRTMGMAASSDDSGEFRVSDIDIEPRAVAQGEDVTVDVTITNIGAETGTREIRVFFGELWDEDHMVTQSLTLEPNEDRELTFELSTGRLPPADDYTVRAMAGASGHMGFTALDVVPGGDGTIFYQVDFIQGTEQNFVGPQGVNSFYGDQGRLIRFLHGTSDDAVTRGGTPGPNALAAESADCVDSSYISVDEAEATASVTFTVEEGCELRLTLVSYVKPGPGFDRGDLQRFFDRDSMTFGPGTHTLTVELPTEDNYQTVRGI